MPNSFKSYNLYINKLQVVGWDSHSLLESILKCSDTDIENLEKEWNITEQENKTVAEANRIVNEQIKQEIIDLFKKIGLLTYKKSSTGKIIGEYKEFKAALEALNESYPKYERNHKPQPRSITINKKEYRSNRSNSLVQLVHEIRDVIKQETAQKHKETAIFAKAASLATGYGIALDDPDLLDKVRESDKEKWVTEHYPEGTVLDHSSCDNCSSWTVGEHRCSCGNRRMYLEIDGDIGSWYAYPTAN